MTQKSNCINCGTNAPAMSLMHGYRNSKNEIQRNGIIRSAIRTVIIIIKIIQLHRPVLEQQNSL